VARVALVGPTTGELPWTIAAAASDERAGRNGTVDSFNADEDIRVIASERYRMGGVRVAPPPWYDKTTAGAEPADFFSAGAQVRFTAREDSEYPPAIEHIWLSR